MISSLIGTYPCSVTFLLVLLFEFAFMLHLSLVQCLPQINLSILEHLHIYLFPQLLFHVNNISIIN